MDIGSFVMESDGTRWATDFGMQDYESLESKGIAVFGRTQDAQRWSIFRLNNYAHNTLTIDHQLQQVKGYAKIDKFSDQPNFMYAISDLSSVYADQLNSFKRGVAIVDQKYVVISDVIAAMNKITTVRWTMLTSAVVKLDKNRITLTKEGHTLTMQIDIPSKVSMNTWSTTPTTTYDAPNPGKTLVGFEFKLKPNQIQEIQVVMVPGSVKAKKVIFEKPLDKW
jgi:hypothetical protein